jgi:LEA14-like dessication related protein
MRFMIFLLALFTFTLTGCSTGGTSSIVSALKPVAPDVSLKNFEMTKMGLSEQTYRLRLNIKNPNAYPLPIQNLNYQLFLNNKPFFKGANNKPVTIPALGEGVIETDINSNIADVVSGWQEWLSLAKRTFNYRIVGDVGVSSYNVPIPFQYADKVDLLFKQ